MWIDNRHRGEEAKAAEAWRQDTHREISNRLAPASWIWTSNRERIPNSYTYFRKGFELPGKPEDLRLYIAAETRYLL